MRVGALELVLRVCEQGFEVVVGGGDAVGEVLEDEGEFVEEIARFGREGEDAVVDGREVELVHYRRHFLFFLLGFCVGDIRVDFVGLRDGVGGFEGRGDAFQVVCRGGLGFALAVATVAAHEGPFGGFFDLFAFPFGFTVACWFAFDRSGGFFNRRLRCAW